MNPKRREPAGVRGSTAASGGNREKPAPQRSERGKAEKPPQIGFRAPQGGLRSRFKSLLLRQNSRSGFSSGCCFLKNFQSSRGVEPEAPGTGGEFENEE